MVAGCASIPPQTSDTDTAFSLPIVFNAKDTLGWEAVSFTGKLRTVFRQQRHEGRDSVQAESVGSASMLRQRLHITPRRWGS